MKEQEKFCKTEKHTIDLDKWYEGLKLNRDPGQKYIEDWVDKHAPSFRKKYNHKKMILIVKDLIHLIEKLNGMSKKKTRSALKSMLKRLEWLLQTNGVNGKNGGK